ncbi:hypothetical protein [Chryseobacterium jejuense]|uniref:Uncharacterized protein n=1 Tax=Chryseobacterium jejuense TaxID=445960 RepID=A0A2X2ZA17_CHRJE|nr:hypothetical protein [Chryseobacterium jejuense]SDI64180.1 hypothetical protein SAMN05421542_1579 [Chryseobacterium jejuense]SQB47310.1 Uncharacterised protein [Chryseobacterium jejuense]
MSTNNNASQTLFRFVSLRNPQLTETKRRNLGFIHRPQGVKGVFDTAITARLNGVKKSDVLPMVAAEFAPSAFKTEKEIETGEFGQLLIIGRQIAKKEKLDSFGLTTTQFFYKELIDVNKELNARGLEVFGLLWNNLIYQVVTQKDFYVKEAISHVLKALHFGFAQNMDLNNDVIKANGDKTPLDNALDGRLVMPRILFVEDDASNPGILNSRGIVAQRSLGLPIKDVERIKANAEKDLQLTQSLLRKQKMETLNAELKPLQESHYASVSKAYQSAYEAYKRTYQEQFTAIEKIISDIEIIKEKKGSEEELQKLYDRLKDLQAGIVPFNFEGGNGLNVYDLQAKLTIDSFDLFMELCSDKSAGEIRLPELPMDGTYKVISETELEVGKQVLRVDDRFQSYSDVVSHIQNQIASTEQTAMENGTNEQAQYANIGGALVPVINSLQRTHLAYSLYAQSYRSMFTSSRTFINFAFEVEDNSWNVANAKVTLESNTGIYEESFNNINVINGMVSFPAMMTGRYSLISKIRINVYFENGREGYLELSNVPANQFLTGMLTLKRAINGAGNEDLTGGNSKRKNFGIKRLGVADYLKVVQSVHAYVPGEVSNIENVMASELRHKSSVSRDYSEVTDTSSASQEMEKTSDTGKTSRTDMQTEVARELERQQNINAHARYSFDGITNKFEIGADYANNTARHDSARQAVMKSQEITEKAMEKVLTKISEERIQKIIKEYTETNVHEFDNRGRIMNPTGTAIDNVSSGPQHITGVYRWVDKKMKNQIYNYGKRTMFEFMVPEPAKLHRLSLAVSKGQLLTAPIDPRKADKPYNMGNAKVATKELLQYWADKYGVQLTDLPKEEIEVYQNIQGRPGTSGTFGAIGTQINITPDYVAKKMTLQFHATRSFFVYPSALIVSNGKGGERGIISFDSPYQRTWVEDGLNLEGTFNFLYRGQNIREVTLNVTLACKLSDTFMDKWYLENFNAIIAAYEAAYQKFVEDQAKLDAEQKKKEGEGKEKTSNFYRYMEHDVLKHNCVAYLLQDYLEVLGQDFTSGDKMENFKVNLGENLDKYTALAKFMEQAFEWDIMDYTFYPYYWANRKMWQEMYLSESVDPLFRSFLQAGMARVIVTVKPGFEDAVQFFLTTGKIWNGGEVPVIGDPMYMSIVDEMRQPIGKPQGKYWITRVPTTLTILQDKSTGLPVEQPLPFFVENDPENCENPSELETKTSFDQRDIQLFRSDKTESTLPKD